jgi:hypothetical protein
MGRRRYREKIRGLRHRIREHQSKINREGLKGAPDEALIRHWQREIRAFENGIERAQKRLRGKG